MISAAELKISTKTACKWNSSRHGISKYICTASLYRQWGYSTCVRMNEVLDGEDSVVGDAACEFEFVGKAETRSTIDCADSVRPSLARSERRQRWAK